MDPEPETFALGIGLVFVLVFAVYRRGQNAGVMHETNKNWIEDDLSWAIETVDAIEEKEVEVDDDLELLDELDEDDSDDRPLTQIV